MKKNSKEYLEWLERRNVKNLKKRSLRKKKAKIQMRGAFSKSQKYNSKKNRKTKEFCVPENFSLLEYPEETLSFFNKLLSFRECDENIFIDLSKVKVLTIDALMYLLAIIYNLREKHFLNVSGNRPINETTRKKFEQSGFYNYVHSFVRL